jgi:predicted nucleic acid-binding protein
MSAKYFLDTNIFVYSFSSNSPSKQKKALALVGEALEEGTGMISFQVIQEFLNVSLHKFEKPLSWEESHQYFEEVLGPLCGVYADAELYRKALRIQYETGYRFYDALIVTSALEGGCKVLYSEDLQDGRKIAGLSIKNPF